jgi:hypothetical protein
MAKKLDKQIADEQAAIDDAPKVPVSEYQKPTSHLAGRCHWCGQFRTDLELVEVIHAVERYKGGCCRAAQ